ncbi:MAG: hypothetical protein GEU80_14320 [Dehalococcoidia bacterium]|nr:hypothetical protein [Dehalococcoidia bacterium]
MSRPASALARSFGCALVLLLTACNGDSAEPSPTATSTPTTDATPEWSVTFDEPAYEGPTTPLQGIFTEPRENEVDRHVSLAPEPEPDFPAWDGESVILYDIESGRTVNLGPGNLGMVPFSPDGTQFIYASGSGEGDARPRVTVYDLETGDSREYGTGYAPSFEGDGTFSVHPEHDGPFTEEDHFDVETGELVFPDENRVGLDSVQTVKTGDGWTVQTIRESGPQTAVRTVIVSPGGGAFETNSSALPLPAQPGRPPRLLVPTEASWGESTNLFAVNEDGTATWLATMHTSATTGGAAVTRASFGTGRIAWTEDHCDPELGRTYVLDLGTGELTEVDRAPDLSIGGAEVLRLGPVTPWRYRATLDRGRSNTCE